MAMSQLRLTEHAGAGEGECYQPRAPVSPFYFVPATLPLHPQMDPETGRCVRVIGVGVRQTHVLYCC